jgi:hypothetical protein
MSRHLSELRKEGCGEVQSEEQPMSRVLITRTADCEGMPTVTFSECVSQRQQNSGMYESIKMG